MEKPLRVLVQIDTRDAAASIEVRGALTGPSCGTLLNILRHTATLGANICVNLTRAVRIEAAALEVLTSAAREVERSAPADPPLQVTIQLPPSGNPDGPAARCRVDGSEAADHQYALDNAAALEMILRRDTRVLAGPRSADTPAAALPSAALPRETAPKWLTGRNS